MFMNRIQYKRDAKPEQLKIRLFASELEFDRNMSLFVGGTKKIMTISFPSTVKEARGGAFKESQYLKSAILNEGLERLEGHRDKDGVNDIGVFTYTQIKRITLPSTIKELGNNTFFRCSRLKCVVFREKSQLEAIGKYCFAESRIEVVTLTSAVRVLGDCTFYQCRELRRVFFREESHLERIGSQCFSKSGIETIAIPRSLKTMGE